jgi:hypothetical protein
MTSKIPSVPDPAPDPYPFLSHESVRRTEIMAQNQILIQKKSPSRESLRHKKGFEDPDQHPDPYQNVTDSEH